MCQVPAALAEPRCPDDSQAATLAMTIGAIMAKSSLLEAFVQGSYCLAHVLEAKPSLLDGEAFIAWR
eukprot:3855424-Alexandrium_andersonii.AAC.1